MVYLERDSLGVSKMIPRGKQDVRGLDGPRIEIGGFRILEKIGQGGMGTVYRAKQVSLDRIVALKVLKPSLAKDLEFIARFRREALAAAKLNHPNIVQAIDVGFEEGTLYFAMEYVEGRSLQQILDKEGALDEEEATRYVRQIAEALVCAHKAGLVHRDIKPDNILVTMDGTVKLADLGLAKGGADSSLTDTGTILGTPYYMSPEQARGDKDLDTSSDLYSLGATWFHMATGRVPFDGKTAANILIKHLSELPPKAHRINPKVSEAVGRIIDRLMRKNRDRRIATPSILLEQLDALAEGERTLVPPEPTQVQPGRPCVRRRNERTKRIPWDKNFWIGLGFGTAVVLAIVGVAFAWQGKSGPRKITIQDQILPRRKTVGTCDKTERSPCKETMENLRPGKALATSDSPERRYQVLNRNEVLLAQHALRRLMELPSNDDAERKYRIGEAESFLKIYCGSKDCEQVQTLLSGWRMLEAPVPGRTEP